MIKLAVATPSVDRYSETFIRSHIRQLPAQIVVLYGGAPPTLVDNGTPLVPAFTIGEHLRWSIQRRIRPYSWEDRSRRYLVKALRMRQVAAVLAEFGPTGVSMVDACAGARIPLIVHFHGFDAYKSDTLTERAADYGQLFDRAAAIVVVSYDMREQLLRLGAPEEKLHLNPYGVDMSQFFLTNPAEAPPHFLAVGRFVDKKGPLLTLLAFHRLLQQVPEARLVMIGDGPLLDASKQLARAMGFAHAVDFRGVQSHYEVAAAMQQARAFVQHSLRPSDGDSEGTPVAVLEASASGLPVIATRHAGIPDVVLEGQTGLLVDEGDVEGMTKAMIRLAQDPQLAAKMGVAGHERVKEHFSMEESIGNLWRIIEAVIEP